MIKLLKANFSRLKKELSLWIVAGVTLALTVPKIVDSYKWLENVKLDDVLFEMVPLIGVLYAVFIALYIGKEYSDKAMRNKLIVGHKYLSCKFYNLLFRLPYYSFYVSVGQFLCRRSAGRRLEGRNQYAYHLYSDNRLLYCCDCFGIDIALYALLKARSISSFGNYYCIVAYGDCKCYL